MDNYELLHEEIRVIAPLFTCRLYDFIFSRFSDIGSEFPFSAHFWVQTPGRISVTG